MRVHVRACVLEVNTPPIAGDVDSGKKVVVFPGRRGGGKGEKESGKTVGHTGHILALAVSSDGKFLVSDLLLKSLQLVTLYSLPRSQASGGHDKVIHIWDAQSNVHLHTFSGHRGPVSVSLTSEGTMV